MLISLLLLACAGAGADPAPPTDDGGADDSGGARGTAACPAGAEGRSTGTLQDPDLLEASGLVASRRDPTLLWIHNDSGNAPVLYAVAEDGQTAGAVTVTGASADDWEDITIGAGPDGEESWLFVGDIGDNGVSDGTARVAMLAEPDPATDSVEATELDLPYPDGPHDAEALLADPISGDLFIITKETGVPAEVFATSPFAPVTELRQVGSVDLSGAAEGILTLVTGADVSPDGRCVYLRTYTHLLGYPRDPALPLETAFQGSPTVLTVLPELQGEAVAADARGYWTVSEGEGAALHRYELP